MAPAVSNLKNKALASLQRRGSNSLTIQEAYDDFILSRKAELATQGTLRFYHFTSEVFVNWLKIQGILNLGEVNNRHVRAYLNEMYESGKKPNYINCHARAIRAFLRFCLEEKYIFEEVKFTMPPTSKERLPYLTAEEVRTVLDTCAEMRDKALIMFMVDTGVRRQELVSLNWGDVDLKSGLALVRRGKGGKTRSVVLGAKTRRVLLAYRRTVEHSDSAPLFQTVSNTRFTVNGLRSLFVRLTRQSGVYVTPHALRRTFATLALRAGMKPLHLQGLLGHTTLEMTRHYVQMVDDDLMAAHQNFGPIDHIL